MVILNLCAYCCFKLLLCCALVFVSFSYDDFDFSFPNIFSELPATPNAIKSAGQKRSGSPSLLVNHANTSKKHQYVGENDNSHSDGGHACSNEVFPPINDSQLTSEPRYVEIGFSEKHEVTFEL